MSAPRPRLSGLAPLIGAADLRVAHALDQGRRAAFFRPLDRFPLRWRNDARPLRTRLTHRKIAFAGPTLNENPLVRHQNLHEAKIEGIDLVIAR